MKNTIIERVYAALDAGGNTELSSELRQFVHGMGDQIRALMALNEKARDTAALYIYTVQSKCLHTFKLDKEQPDTIACNKCGHSIQDAGAAKFVRRVMQGDYFLYRQNDGSATLNPQIKKSIVARGLWLPKKLTEKKEETVGQTETV